MPYDDPLFIAAKWGRIIGSDPERPEAEDASREAIEQWALEQLAQGPEEAVDIHAKILADPQVREAFTELLHEPM